MAEYSWTLKDTGDTVGTGYLSITNPATITVSGASFTPTMPTVKLKVNDKYAASNDSFKYTLGDLRLYCGSTLLDSGLSIYNGTYVKNNVYANSAWRGTSSISTSSVFTASNKTSRTVGLVVKLVVADYPGFSSYSNLMGVNIYYDEITSAKDLATINVTLNAPPTTSYTQVQSNTSGSFYKDVTTATVTLSNLSAKYGGTISEAKLTIGSQTATRTTNGDLAIRLNATGTFTPTISLKDSRGQTASYTLNAITVVDGTETTFDYTPLASSTSPYYYAGKTVVSTDISNVVVPYSGTFTARLIVGQQIAESFTEGTLSIPLSYVGTFTPRIEVTDSFGRTYGVDLSPITVGVYSAPSCHLEVQRTRPSSENPTPIGRTDDEGESATLIAEFTYTDTIAHLLEPTISVVNSDGTSVQYMLTWYSSRDATTGALSGSVTWANVSSGDTVYGLVSSTSAPYPLDAQESYQITLTPNDNYGSGEPSSQTVSTAFYTIDFLAGGHGIAFGLPATKQDVFECGLDAQFKDKAGIMRALFDFMHPVGSYYETSDTSFDPNVSWGGIWQLDSAGKVTVARDANDADFDTIGETGGVKTHLHTTGNFTLGTNHIPAHTHGSKTLTGGWKDNSMCSLNSVNKLGNVSGIVTRATSKGDQYYTTSGRTKTANQYDEITITATHTHDSVGGGQAHNHGNTGNGSNVQPYVVVNRWHRTA